MQESQPQDRLIGVDEVTRRVDLSKPTIWRMRKRGEFPAPVSISPRRKAWSENSITEWINARLSAA